MGQKYNLADHEQRHSMPAIAVTIEAVTTVLLWIRIANRFVHNSRLGIDDVLIIIAWILGVCLTVAVLIGTERFGFNRHIWDVPIKNWWKGAFVSFIVENLFLWSTCMTKISVLMFYRRLVVGTYSRKFKFAIWAAIAFVIAYTISFFVVILVTCGPIQAQWRQYDPNWNIKHSFHCPDRDTSTAVAKLIGALSVVTDFYSVMLPAVLLLQIRISRRQKYGLLFIFGIGFLVVGAGVARTIFLGRVFEELYDRSWLTWEVYLASIIECNIAILCACAPSLKALFGVFFANVASRYGSKGSTKSGSSDRSHGSSNSTTAFAKESGRGQRKPSALSRMYAVDDASPEKDESSFKQAHEYGKDYRETIAVGYGEKLVLPPMRSLTPMTTQLFDEPFTLPMQNGTHASSKHMNSAESYIISPSPSETTDDEISLVGKPVNTRDAGLPYGLPEREEPLVRSYSQRSQGHLQNDALLSPIPVSRPSTSRSGLISPLSNTSVFPYSLPDSLVSSQPDPLIPRKLSRDRWEKQTRFPAI